MDLFLALILMTLFTLWTTIVGIRMGKHSSCRSKFVVQMLVVGVSSFYFVFLWNRPCLTQWFPHTALIVLGNWHPVMGSFFAGMYLSSPKVRRRRRLLIGPVTLVLAGYSIVAPVVGHVPACIPVSSASPLITQTTPYTCSPAVAASLLRLHGIAATESKMAELCLTRRGTHWLGVYRGLKLMTETTPWEVVAESFSREALLKLKESPALLSINVDTNLIERDCDHGFRSSVGHSVLVLDSHVNHEVIVFDPSPSYGVELWSRKILSWVSYGVILRLVKRDGSAPDATVRERISQAAHQHNRFASFSWNEKTKPENQTTGLEAGRPAILARVAGSMEITSESRH